MKVVCKFVEVKKLEFVVFYDSFFKNEWVCYSFLIIRDLNNLLIVFLMFIVYLIDGICVCVCYCCF